MRPEPVAVTTVCSICGLGWELHGVDPTTEDCIRLLKAELARRPIMQPVPYPVPYPRPYPSPWPYPSPIWHNSQPTITCTSGQQLAQTRTPRIVNSNVARPLPGT